MPVVEREDDPTRFVPLVTPNEPFIAGSACWRLTLNSKAASLLPDLRVSSGVVVASTTRRGDAGLGRAAQGGDLIHALNGAPSRPWRNSAALCRA